MTDTITTLSTDKQLPLDPDGQNDARAEWADRALQGFQVDTGTDREDAIGDLLCNLMHLCDRDEELGNFEAQLERARGHYESETASGHSWEAYHAYLENPANRPEGMSDDDWNSYCPSFDEWKRGRWHPPASTIVLATDIEGV